MAPTIAPIGGPFPFRVEEWDPIGRGITVLGFLLEARPAVECYIATLEWRPGRELRLRHTQTPDAGADYREMNYAVVEWDASGHVRAVHAHTLSILPARAAYEAVIASHAGHITLAHQNRVLEKRPAA